MQTADCRLATKCRLGTKCRLQIRYKMQTNKKNIFLRQKRVNIRFYNLPTGIFHWKVKCYK